MRHKDQDGRLHVANCRLSKATVNPYRGREIPRWQHLGLDPDTVYQLWRHPAELEKAAATWNGIPLMSDHVPHSAAAPVERAVAGAIGTNARWEAPYVVADLSIWRADDILDVETREKCELSSGYYYDADMVPGETPEGLRFDGIMRNIRANHVALVEAGRAGPDVMVHDALPKGLTRMALPSRHALMVRGAIASHIRPKLAAGTSMLALDAALADTFADTWSKQRPIVQQRVQSHFAPHLAAGASLDDLPTVLMALDAEREDDDEDDLEAEDAEMTEAERKEERKARAEDRKKAMDAAGRKAARDSRRQARDAKRARDKNGLEEWVKEEEQEPEHRGAKDRKMVKDAAGHRGYMVGDKWHPAKDARMRGARDETEEDRKKEAEDTKHAMDAAIRQAADETEARLVKRFRALDQAREDVRPYIGSTSMALDSAAAVYKLALDGMKVDVADVPPEAYRALLLALPKPKTGRDREPALAMDHASTGSLYSDFPMAGRIRHA